LAQLVWAVGMFATTCFGALIYLAGSFCTTYAPLDGSRFSFPPKRCLTPEFMEEQFQNGNFGKERINLSSKVQDLVYNSTSMPLAVEASLGWESGHTVSAIADIILREVLGINTIFVCTWGSVHAMKMLGGCKNPMDPSRSCAIDGVPELSVPLAHVSVESWVTTPAEVDEMNNYNTNLGMIGYVSKSGLYMDAEIAAEAFRNDGLSLEWWQSFVDIPDVAKYFDTFAVIAEDIGKTWPDGSVSPRCRGDDAGFIELRSLGFTCVDGWFFGPVCEANKHSCVPVVLAEYDWNGLVWVRAVVQHGYRFAVTWLGSQNWLQYSMRTSKRMLFYCATTSAFCYEKPIVKMFADTKMPVGRPDLITSLLKVVWKQLPNLDARVVDFLSQMNLPSDDLRAIMYSYSEKQAWADLDARVPEIACDWLTNKLSVLNVAGGFTGANAAKWARWIPRVCQKGNAYDKALSECRPCRAGKYSFDGRSCIPCSPGTYAAEDVMAACNLCEEGTWQSASGGTTCIDCPPGSQRSANDYGCQPCAMGHFAEHARQPDCIRCEPGRWTDKVGARQCDACPFSYTTPHEASTSLYACAIDPITVLQLCVLSSLPFVAAIVGFLLWKWSLHRRQLTEARQQEQMYFRGAVAVMRTMCSSGITLRITPEGYIKHADPKDGLEGLQEGTNIQECIADVQDLERFNRHLQGIMREFDSATATTFASPFDFCIAALSGGKVVHLKTFAVAFRKDEILMGIKRRKHEFGEQQQVLPVDEMDASDPPTPIAKINRRDRQHGFDFNLSVLPGAVCADHDSLVSFTLSHSTFAGQTASERETVVVTRDSQTQTSVEPLPDRLPPRLPSPKCGRRLRRTRSTSSSRSTSSHGSNSRRRTSSAGNFRATPLHTIGFMICERARNLHVDPKSACCHLHAAVDIIQEVASSRQSVPCNHAWKPNSGWQCEDCRALNDNSDDMCAICVFPRGCCL